MNNIDVTNNLVKSKEESKIIEVKWRDAVPQIFASLCSYAIVIQGGVNLAFSAILIPQLKEDNSDIKITTEEASWIASLVAISLPIGSLSLGPLMDKFGRKKICILACIPFIISWLLVMTANNVIQLYVARIIAGTGGGFSAVSLVYVSEICHPTYRPMLLGLNSAFVSLGILITCALGVWCTWRMMAIIYFIMSCLCLLVLIPIPESPYWFITFGKTAEEVSFNEISKSLHWIYRNDMIFEEELKKVIELKNSKMSYATSTSVIFLNKICKPGVYKPVLILLTLFFLQQASGGYVIIFYAIDIIKNITNNLKTDINDYYCLFLLGILRFVMSFVTSILSTKFGRKDLLYIGILGMSISALLIVIHIYFKFNLPNAILVLYLLVFVMNASLSFFVIPWGLMGELLPTSVRGIMSGIMITWANVNMFTFVKFYPFLLDILSIQGLFLLYSVVCILSVIFVRFFVPETFNKSLSDIEKYFIKRERNELEQNNKD